MRQIRLDAYVVDTLLPDLVLHDRHPSAFLVYLYLSCQRGGRSSTVRASHNDVAHATGLSKSAVQTAIRTLIHRRLIRSTRTGRTSIPEYAVLRPWRR